MKKRDRENHSFRLTNFNYVNVFFRYCNERESFTFFFHIFTDGHEKFFQNTFTESGVGWEKFLLAHSWNKIEIHHFRPSRANSENISHSLSASGHKIESNQRSQVWKWLARYFLIKLDHLNIPLQFLPMPFSLPQRKSSRANEKSFN